MGQIFSFFAITIDEITAVFKCHFIGTLILFLYLIGGGALGRLFLVDGH